MTPRPLYWCSTASPVGDILLVGDGSALTGVHLADTDLRPSVDVWVRNPGLLRSAREQLAGYFAGEVTAFDLPVAPAGTAFQLAVWAALLAVPFGTTVSYSDVARRLGRPGAARAVGAANGRNPISIIVPCHRVVGADGSLGGYTGGVHLKELLIRHERSVLDRRAAFDPVTPGRLRRPRER